MPYISVSVSKPLQPQQKDEIKAALGKLITIIPGKFETTTMIRIEDGCTFYKSGRALDNGAFVEVRLFGNAPRPSKEELTQEIFKALEKQLGIVPGDMYLNIMEFDNWGTGGRLK